MAAPVVPVPAQNILQGIKMPNRRNILKTIGGTVAATFLPGQTWGDDTPPASGSAAKITKIEMVTYEGPGKRTTTYLEVASDAGTAGRFGPFRMGAA
jgi:hypothetical protein